MFLPKIIRTTWVFLRGSKVSDAGFVHLKGMIDPWPAGPRSEAAVTDDGDGDLEGSDTPRSAGPCGTKVTDAGVEHLKKLDSTHRTKPAGTQVTRQGSGNSKLTKLRLRGPWKPRSPTLVAKRTSEGVAELHHPFWVSGSRTIIKVAIPES